MPSALRFRPGRSPATSSRNHAAARRGRALVELLIATLLLTIAASTTLTLLQASAALARRTVQVAAVRDVARDQAERLQAAPCAAMSGHSNDRGLESHWTISPVGRLVTLHVRSHIVASPLGPASPRSLEARAAGWCR